MHLNVLPDDCVDAPDFVGHLPGALETPNVVVTECITKIPVPKVWTFLVIWLCCKHEVWLRDVMALPTQIRLGVHPVESPRRPGELSLVTEPVHGVRKGGA